MLNSIPSYTYTTICLSSHVVRHLSSFHFLATINITIKCAYKYFDVHIFLFSLVLKPRIKLLGHKKKKKKEQFRLLFTYQDVKN